ncbi:MAG: molybdopterin-guanine dinucleotide biosynthesis protein B [Nitrospirae bacterium]|nr:molybdopterin-guanine dinucleotide biosynthesis protein B [Nitrospirota bacterium]
MTHSCIISVSGYSESGKTTLIERALPELRKQGISVGILKHVHHMLSPDREGKDTDRFYRAGADFVSAHDLYQGFARYPMAGKNLGDALEVFPPGLDLIIVEGHKQSELSGVWLEPSRQKKFTVRGKKSPVTVLFRDETGYLEKFLEYIYSELEKSLARRPVMAGLLIGGRSLRMGTSKALLKFRGKTLVKRSFDTLSLIAQKTMFLGSSDLPLSLRGIERLPDVSDVRGPMAGMLSAFRWALDSSWIISAVDMPLMDEKAWNWLLDQRRPGVWAVLPRLSSARTVETTGACYEPMIFGYIESLASEGIVKLQKIADHPKVISPVIPDSLAYAWRNVNTPSEWKKLTY